MVHGLQEHTFQSERRMKKATLLGFGAELTKAMFVFSYAFLVLVGLANRINEGTTLEEYT